MSFCFLHTGDWQIGKAFGELGPEKGPVLRAARLDAIDRLAAAARSSGADNVLVAGDVFDFATGSPALVKTTLARLAAHPGLTWHLMPGNHDPARAGSVWDDMSAAGPPHHVRLHLTCRAAEIAPGVVLLPAPLTTRATATDPTSWMNRAETEAGSVRIGLAHGSVQGFGSERTAAVPIDPGRAGHAGLAYLALGDWHGRKKIDERTWYAGTPEPDSHDGNEQGSALLVRIDGPSAPPRVEPIRTGTFDWMAVSVEVRHAKDIDALERAVAGRGWPAARVLCRAALRGAVTLRDHAAIVQRLDALAAKLFDLRSRLDSLTAVADPQDLEALDSAALRAVAERLVALSRQAGPREAAQAQRALLKMHALAAGAASPVEV